METWKIVLISVLTAVVVGVIGGIIIGKYLVKRAKNGSRRLLSDKERIIYAACLLLGTACILVGVFFKFPANLGNMMGEDGGMQRTEGERNPGKGGVVVDDMEVAEAMPVG